MARWRKPSQEEVLRNRRELADKARTGGLPLPEAVREIRRGHGLSQKEFAALLRLTPRQLAEIERGEGNPTLATLNRIGKLFGFSVGFISDRNTTNESQT